MCRLSRRTVLLGVGGLTLAFIFVLYLLHNFSNYKLLVIGVGLPVNSVQHLSSSVLTKGEAVPTSSESATECSTPQSLVEQLQKLIFLNTGVVTRKDEFVWKNIRCGYLEAQNVSMPYSGWADKGHVNYLHQKNSGYLVSPPSGMRSSIPHGGW